MIESVGWLKGGQVGQTTDFREERLIYLRKKKKAREKSKRELTIRKNSKSRGRVEQSRSALPSQKKRIDYNSRGTETFAAPYRKQTRKWRESLPRGKERGSLHQQRW